MKHTTIWIAALFALAFGIQQGSAGTVLGTTGQKCFSTNFTNFTAQPAISVYGDWIENIDRVTTTTSGLTITVLGKFNGAQNNSGSFAGKGRVDLNIKTSNATPGTATIKLINDPDLGIGGETFSFTINVIPPPTVTSADIPTPADPFNNITVTLHGTGLQQAKDPASGVIVQDNLIPFITVGGNASVSNVRVLSSSATSLQAQISFSALIQDATVELSLKSDNECDPLGVLPMPATRFIPFKTRVRVKSSNVKNYITGVDFPFGSVFDQHSIATINLKLLFPAPSSGGRITLVGGKIGSTQVSASENSTVFFKLVPSTVADTVGNGTPIVTNGLTTLHANPGDNIIPITFRVDDCGGGTPGSTSTVILQTWMHSTNTTQPPDFVQVQFSVRCKL
jgi:hypothetical protein